MSEADLAAFRDKHGAGRVHDPMDGRAALLALDLPAARFKNEPTRLMRRAVTDPALAALLPLVPDTDTQGRSSNAPVRKAGATAAAVPGVKAKRRGVDLAPIMASLKHPVREAMVGAGADGPTLSLWFTGSRMLTVNDLFSILPFRKYDTWAYKKRWKTLIQEAIHTLDPAVTVPLFDGPTRLVLFRRGTNKIDLDSFQTVFKYAIDGLRKAGVLVEDNPEIMVDTVSEQRTGAPAVGLRLERLLSWVKPEEFDVHERWFGTDEPAQPPVLALRQGRARTTAAPAPQAPAKPRIRSLKTTGPRGQAVPTASDTPDTMAQTVPPETVGTDPQAASEKR